MSMWGRPAGPWESLGPGTRPGRAGPSHAPEAVTSDPARSPRAGPSQRPRESERWGGGHGERAHALHSAVLCTEGEVIQTPQRGGPSASSSSPSPLVDV